MNLSDSKERLALAKKIFNYADYFDGTLSGGVNPPWIFEEVTELRKDDEGCSLYRFEYKLPDESHPNSDVTYHVTNPDKLYAFSVLLYNDGTFVPMDPNDLFLDSFLKDEIARFCEENNLSLKSPDDYVREGGYTIPSDEKDDEMELS